MKLLRSLAVSVLLSVLVGTVTCLLAPVLPVQVQRSLAEALPHLPGAHAQHRLSLAAESLAAETLLVSNWDRRELASWPLLERRWSPDEGLTVRASLFGLVAVLSAALGLSVGLLLGAPGSRKPLSVALLMGLVMGGLAVGCLRSESGVVAWPVLRGLSGLPGLVETGDLVFSTGVLGGEERGDRYINSSGGVLVAFDAGPPPWEIAPRGELSRQLLWCGGFGALASLGLVLLRQASRSVSLLHLPLFGGVGLALLVFICLPFLPVMVQRAASSALASTPGVDSRAVPQPASATERLGLALGPLALLESPAPDGDWRFRRGAVLQVRPALVPFLSVVFSVLLCPVALALGLRRRFAGPRLAEEEEDGTLDGSIPLLEDDGDTSIERLHVDD